MTNSVARHSDPFTLVASGAAQRFDPGDVLLIYLLSDWAANPDGEYRVYTSTATWKEGRA